MTATTDPVSGGGILKQLGVGSSSFNVMLLLALVLNVFSSSQLQTAAVQAQTTLQESTVEVDLSNKGMEILEEDTAELQGDTNQYNQDLKDGKKSSVLTTDQNNISQDNTDFSLALQVMNTNVQTAQGLSQGSETASQMTTSAIQAMSALFSLVNQMLSFVSNLIQQI